jgi:cardiolipin synthase (CMP-forming)
VTATGAPEVATVQEDADRRLTIPNAITVIRLSCLPLFLWLLFGKEDRVAAAFLLGALGATDWIDGYVARRYHQVSELGKVLDPLADRLLFIVGVGALIIDGSVPLVFAWLVVAREVVLGGALVVLTLAGMQRFDVSLWGKAGTFTLMVAFPLFLLGASDAWGHEWWQAFGWMVGIPGLLISYYAAVTYIPTIRHSLAAGRAAREGGGEDGRFGGRERGRAGDREGGTT